MYEFQLFRIKVQPVRQTRLYEADRKLYFDVPEASPEVLREVLFSVRETARKERVWHIGDILPIEGCFPKNSIKDSRLTDRLLAENVLETDTNDPDKVYFNHIVKNETRLTELLKRLNIEDRYLETIRIFWRETLKESGLHFQLGKTRKLSRPRFNEGRFFDERAESSPYTNVILDVKYKLCALARKSQLSPDTKGIANRFVKLLNLAGRTRILGVHFEIEPVIDPEDFLSQLNLARSVRKFWINFSRISPLGEKGPVNSFQASLREVGGLKGKAEFKGANLKAGPLVKLAREAASAGYDAGAVLQFEKNGPLFHKTLRENPVVITQKDFIDKKDRRELLYRLRDKFNRITASSF